MDTPDSPTHTRRVIDHAAPFKDIVVCCTSIPTEGRTIIAQRVNELGGIHKYDLTPDVTHLIVGDYDTPKYRHVARERLDIKAMDASWIVTVAELWKNGDDDFDFDALETKHQLQPFDRCGSMPVALAGDGSARHGLLISLTGFGDARDGIAERIMANGATYTPDLTKQCTHLIVHQPEGKKFTAAKQWGVHTVSVQWLDQSIERGLILEENKFDPLLPLEEQGLGAWLKKEPPRALAGKRSRSGTGGPGEDGKGPRKLRKTASMKLNSQRDGLWGDILKRSDLKENSMEDRSNSVQPAKEATSGATKPQEAEAQQLSPSQPQGVFAEALFCIHGFLSQRAQILDQTIVSLGGLTVPSLDNLVNTTIASDASRRFLIVPQSSQPNTHPKLPADNINIVTEFYIEKCLHNKQFFDPRDHVVGRPFPAFPIPDLASMTVCTAAFTGIELSQVARSVTQLGATFAEEFRPSASVLICRSLAATRKEKLKCALAWGVPVVSAEWLWECISTGCCVPLKNFTFTELKKRRSLVGGESFKQNPTAHEEKAADPQKSGSDASLPPTAPAALAPPRAKANMTSGVDHSGFDNDDDEKPQTEQTSKPRALSRPTKHDSTTSADFQTARTTLIPTRDTDSPLTERSSASLNKSPSPTKPITSNHDISNPRTKSDPTSRYQENPGPVRAPSAPSTDEEMARAQHQAALLTSRLGQLVSTAASGSTPSVHTSMEDLKPRRRQLLGRATSNVSATSSNANNTAAPVTADTYGTDEDPEDAAGGPLVEGQASDEQPSTQLVYGDPEAQGVKAQIMSRMAGEDLKGRPKSKSSGGPTLTTVGGRTLRKRL